MKLHLSLLLVLLIAKVASAHADMAPSSVIDMDLDEPTISEVSVSGLITPPMLTTLKARLQKNFNSRRRTAILIASPGGQMELAPALANLINESANEFYRRYFMTTIVEIQTECSSACTLFLAQLHKQSIGSNALELIVADDTDFYFHAPRTKVGDQFKPIDDEEDYEAQLQIEMKQYLDAGVNPVWLKANMKIFSPTNEGYTTAAQLCRMNSGLLDSSNCQPVEGLVDKVIDVLLSKGRFRPRN